MSSQRVQKTGVAFSGGGVRSAAFCSGVLRRLLQKRVAIDYLSSVSGGGYTAASYMDWKYRHGKKDDPAWHKEYFEHIRKHSNILCDCFSPLRGFLDGVVTAFLMIFLSIGLLLLRVFSFVIPIIFIVDYFFGDILRDQFTCKEANANKTIQGISKEKLLELCLPTFGPKMEIMFQVTLSWLAAFVISYYLSTVVRNRTPKYLLTVLYRLSGFGLAMVFLPWFLEMYRSFTPSWAKYLLLIVIVVIWLFFPALREKALYALFIFLFAYSIKWYVYETPVADVKYTHELYMMLVWVSAGLLWIHPYLGMLQMFGSHLFVEWRLIRTYFSDESRTAGIWFNSSPLTLADLKGMQPEYQSNVTVNNWRKTNAQYEKDYEVLTLSPTVIERIDRKQDDVEFSSKGFITPKDIRLSSAMITSASASSYDDGKLRDSNKSSREIRIAFGLGYGNNLVAQKGLTKTWMPWVVTSFLQVVFGFIIISIPVALHFKVLEDVDYWYRVLMLLLIILFLLCALIAIMPIGRKGFISTLTRWCIINILHVRLMRTIFDITDVGPTPPPVLSLSDGGHTENLGLLPLLKLRLPRIVVVNGGAVGRGRSYATDLLKAIKQAREKLRCSFSGLSGRDIVEDIRDHFVETEKGKQPRSYRFKIQYYEKDGYESKLVGEGEVLILMPRHPDDGMKQFQDYKWSDFDGDVKLDLDEYLWGPGPALKTSEADRMSGCCCECCHSKPFNYILKFAMSGFPFNSSLNPMYTPSQFSAYHREGYHACVEAEAEKFLEKDQSLEVVTSQPQGFPTPTTVIDVTEF